MDDLLLSLVTTFRTSRFCHNGDRKGWERKCGILRIFFEVECGLPAAGMVYLLLLYGRVAVKGSSHMKSESKEREGGTEKQTD